MVTPVAFVDANTLYPAPLRDLLIELALAAVVAVRWSDNVHEEWMAALAHQRPDLPQERLQRTRALMEQALPDARVSGFEAIIETLALPDQADRHVLAAAIAGEAKFILTFNLKDFPAEALTAHDMVAVHPDAFLPLLLELAPRKFIEAVRRIRGRLVKPTMTARDYLIMLARCGLPKLAIALSKVESEL